MSVPAHVATRFGTGSRTLAEMVAAMSLRRGPALRVRRDDGIHEMTYVELGRRARHIAGGLLGLGMITSFLRPVTRR
jgi:hypothetical protein